MLNLAQIFDENFYRDQNPDVDAAVNTGAAASGFEHFIQLGQFEGRDPSLFFNTGFYLGQNPDVNEDVSQGTISAVDHFIQFGQLEQRNPNSDFNTGIYLTENPDVSAAVSGGVTTGFQHFVEFGIGEGRIFSQPFISTQFDIVVTSAANNGNDAALRFDGLTGRFLGDFTNNNTTTLRVTVENIGPEEGLFISQTWVGFHDGSFDSFNIGEPASEAIERLAEDAIIEPTGAFQNTLTTAFTQGTQGIVPGLTGPFRDFFPGDIASATFEVNPSRDRYFTYGAMGLPSNDAFIGNDNPFAYEIFDAQGNFIGADIIVTGDEVWDAGTEVNDEIPENTAALDQMAPNTGVDENGVVTPHPGFIPGGNILAAFPNADFTTPGYQVARITVEQVSEPTELNDPRDIVVDVFDPTTVLINSGDDNVLRFQADDGTLLETFAEFPGLNGGGAVFGPNGNYFVGARSLASILEFDGQNGDFIQEFIPTGTVDFPRGFVFGSNGDFFLGNGADPATGSGGGTLVQFDGLTGELINPDFVSDPQLSPLDVISGLDGNVYVSSEFPFGDPNAVGTVRIYDVNTGELLNVLDAGFDESGEPRLTAPRGMGFGPDDNLYVSSTGTESIIRFDPTTGEFIDVFTEFPNLNGQALNFVPAI